jgi:hypothetical protein
MKLRFALLGAVASVFCFLGSAHAVPVEIVPEPATFSLLASGVVGVLLLRNKFKK